MNCIKVWNQVNVRIRTSDRYVCLTDMAKATGKQINDWSRLQGTQDYLDRFSAITGYPVMSKGANLTALLYITKGGNQETGTWAHPKVALRFAQWCSDDFAIQVDTWIDELLTTGSVQLAAPQLSGIDKAKASCDLIDVIFVGVPLKPELLAGIKINMTERLAPELAGCFDEARQLLIGNTAQPDLLMTATEIGKRLGISAQAVNKKLVKLGLQIKNPSKKSKKDCAYLPIGQGQEFSDLTLATGTGKDNTTYQQLRWYSSTLSLLVV